MMLCVLPTAFSRHDSTAWKAITQNGEHKPDTSALNEGMTDKTDFCLFLCPANSLLPFGSSFSITGGTERDRQAAGFSSSKGNWQGQQMENNYFHF